MWQKMTLASRRLVKVFEGTIWLIERKSGVKFCRFLFLKSLHGIMRVIVATF